MADAVLVQTIVIAVVCSAVLIAIIAGSVVVVKEREVMIIERLGNFHSVLAAGVHFIFPFIDRPKKFWFRYWITKATDAGLTVEMVEGKNLTRVFVQDTVLDFPRLNVITRDNASVYIDSVLSFKVVNPKLMLYSCVNLQAMLSKLLQSMLRNLVSDIDVDQLVEDAGALNALTALMDEQTSRWGVKIKFVRVQVMNLEHNRFPAVILKQRLDTPGLEEVLARKKRADDENRRIHTQARAHKQSTIMESEGKRDGMIKEAEGEAQELLSRAEGQSQAIINAATAEARAVKEIARSIAASGENPAKYLLAMKYLEALKRIIKEPNTSVRCMPDTASAVLGAKSLGVSVSQQVGGGSFGKFS